MAARPLLTTHGNLATVYPPLEAAAERLSWIPMAARSGQMMLQATAPQASAALDELEQQLKNWDPQTLVGPPGRTFALASRQVLVARLAAG